jgi:transketolase C-terminal domain/subunit
MRPPPNSAPNWRPAMAEPRQAVLAPPYRTVLKPYGRALAELARARPEVVCLSGDLTRQCEVDLFQREFPERFIHAGMAEANMIGVAGALARQGLMPFVHSFGVFTTRRALDQIVNAVAYPRLPVRIAGFMPGVSSPGGPSHQAIEDIALMRALPGMTVIDVADATETAQVVAAMADVPGPVYLRLKRGEIPVIFPGDHRLSLDRAQVLEWRPDATAGGGETSGGAGSDGGGVTTGGADTLGGAVTVGGAQIAGRADTSGGGASAGGGATVGGAQISGRADTRGGGVSAGGGASGGGAGISDGGCTSGTAPSSDVALLVSGMMVAPALAAARVLWTAGVVTVVVNIPVIKPLDTATVLAVATAAKAAVTAENHTIIGGLGSAVAETLAESGLGRPLRRIGLADTFAEGANDAPYLFTKYGLSTQHIVEAAWSVLGRPGSSPRSPTLPADVGEYAPV